MKTIKKTIDNEQGFVLIVSLLILMVLMIIGIAATNTTTIELQISGNDKLAKQVFYQAEGAVAEAFRIIANDSSSALDDPNVYKWLERDPDGSGVLTVGAGGTELADVYDNTTPSTIWSAATLPSTEIAGAFRGIAHGSSLGLGSSRIHLYDLYGRSQQHNARAIIKEGCRLAF